MDHLRAFRGRKLAAHVPLALLACKRRRRVWSGGGEIDFRVWEIEVLVQLRDRLRSGDIWVDGGRTLRGFAYSRGEARHGSRRSAGII